MENKQTAVTWLINELIQNRLMALRYDSDNTFDEIYKKAKQMEKESMVEELIGFQIYLNDKGLITNHDWDFEKESKKYYKKTHGTN